MKYFAKIWNKYTTDQSILQLIHGAKIDFTCDVIQTAPRMPIHCTSEDKQKIDIEICKYLKLGIIEETEHCDGEFVNQIFPTPKKSGGVRIILNLKPLNVDIAYEHFKMENFLSVLKLIEQNCFMSSIDLRDAYYSVNIHHSYRKYLRFIWNSKLYQFTCLPNGLTSAPRWFTKLLKPIFAYLRSLGYISVYYLDDTWLMGKTKEQCSDNVNATSRVLLDAGFLINEEKSKFEPSQHICFLGFELDSVEMIVKLPYEKREKIVYYCNLLLEGNEFTIRFVAKVIGTLVACLPAVQYGALFYRYLEYDKIAALAKSAGNFDSHMTLSHEARSEVDWWLKHVLTCSKRINVSPYSLMITTDASKLGWGAVYNEQSTGGRWTLNESNLHINELELQAIYFGLLSFFTNINNEHIRIQSDNMTAVTYINNLGGVKSIRCHERVKQIWLWAMNKGIYLSAEFLPGSDNTMADGASRIFDENTEWTLMNSVYTKLLDNSGPFSIDLFASRLNNKCDVYAAWKPDPSALFIDAFSRNWSKFDQFYAFPPFSLILQCIQKISVDGARGTLVVPLWPTQPWFPKLMGILTSPPIVLPLNVLNLPFQSNLLHKQWKNLRLIACQVSGNFSEVVAFQNGLLTSCTLPGDHPHASSMKYILKSGCISVIANKIIPCVIMRL